MSGDKIRMTLITATVVIACQVVGAACEDAQLLHVSDLTATTPPTWTEYTSEEQQPLVCMNRQVMRGVDCAGDYCDNIALDCTHVGDVQIGDDTWSPYFSEEADGGKDQRQCASSTEWMTGITCRGKYCDDISVRCTELPGTATGTCTWSNWYSDEDQPFSAPDGQYIKAIECQGNFCDNKRFRYCALKVM